MSGSLTQLGRRTTDWIYIQIHVRKMDPRSKTAEDTGPWWKTVFLGENVPVGD